MVSRTRQLFHILTANTPTVNALVITQGHVTLKRHNIRFHCDCVRPLRTARTHPPLRPVPVESNNPQKRLLELLIGERVAERVDGTVEIAQPVGYVIEHAADAPVVRAEAHDHREDVPRRPAEHEGAEDDGDRAQGLARAVLRLALLRRLRLLASLLRALTRLPGLPEHRAQRVVSAAAVRIVLSRARVVGRRQAHVVRVRDRADCPRGVATHFHLDVSGGRGGPVAVVRAPFVVRLAAVVGEFVRFRGATGGRGPALPYRRSLFCIRRRLRRGSSRRTLPGDIRRVFRFDAILVDESYIGSIPLLRSS